MAGIITPNPDHLADIGSEGDWPENLSREHVAYQRERAVGPRIAAERGLSTIYNAESLPEYDWSTAVRDALGEPGNSAMVIPIHGLTGECVQLRIDSPPQNADGKRQKFTIPMGVGREDHSLPPDIHPLAQEWVDDPSIPLVITEGQAKADSMLTASFREGVRIVPVALTGVTLGYMAAKPDEGRPNAQLAPGLAQLALTGRTVFLVFDADAMTNAMVAGALRKTGELLHAHGARVYIPQIPAVGGNAKAGVDDYLAAAQRDGAFQPLTTLLNGAAALAERFPIAGVLEVSDEPEARLPELMRAWAGKQVALTPTQVAVIGGDRHGLWALATRRNPETGAEETVTRQVTDYILWRSEKAESKRILEDGTLATITGCEPTYTVEVVRRDRKAYRAEGLSVADSSSPSAVVRTVDAGVALPSSRSDLEVLGNALLRLGFESGRDEVDQITSAGWMLDPEHGPVYLGATSSISATGPTTQVLADTRNRELSPAHRQTGWAEASTSETAMADAQCIAGFMATAPGKPELAVALIGALFSAPLRLDRRASVLTIARPGVGKSVLATRLQSFLTASTKPAIDLPKASRPAAEIIAAWARDSIVVADDFKLMGDSKDIDRKAVLGGLVQAAYSGAFPQKSRIDGTLRESRDITSTLIATAEDDPDDVGIRQRAVIVHLDKGDIDLTSGGPIDEWKTRYEVTGVARRFYGLYLQSLAQVAASQGLDGLKQGAEEHKTAWYARLEHARAGETAAVIATGWEALWAFSEQVGLTDVIPPRDEIEPLIYRLCGANAQLDEDASPYKLLMAAASEQLVLKRMHLEPGDGTSAAEESALATLIGWKVDDRSQMWVRSSTPLGYLSMDRKHVVIPPASMKELVRRADLSLPGAKLDRALADIPGGRNKRCSSTLGITSPLNPRGWVVPVADLGLDNLPSPEIMAKLREEATF